MTYSLDFRKQVLRSLDEGMTVRRAAKFYHISTSTLYSWQQNLEPKLYRDKKPTKVAEKAFIRQRVAQLDTN